MERRAEELKNGAKEGTETAPETGIAGSANYGSHPADDGGRSGEAAASAEGRERRLRNLGVHPRLLKLVRTGCGAWKMARNAVMNAGLSNASLRRYGFLLPSDLAAMSR